MSKHREKHREIISFMRKYQERNGGCPPSIREIADKVGITSTSVMNYQLNLLVQVGRLKRSVDRHTRTYFVPLPKPESVTSEEAVDIAAALTQVLSAIQAGGDPQAVLLDAIVEALPDNARQIYRLIGASTRGISLQALAGQTRLGLSEVRSLCYTLRELGLIRRQRRVINQARQDFFRLAHTTGQLASLYSSEAV